MDFVACGKMTKIGYGNGLLSSYPVLCPSTRRHEFNLLQINSVLAVAKKVKARNDGRSPKEHVEPESIMTSETVVHSRDKEHDWTDLREQSHVTKAS